MKTSEVLTAAADYHAEHGACKGTYRTEDGRVCLLGAIYGALGVEFWHGNSPLPTRQQHKDFIAARACADKQMHAEGVNERFVHVYNDREDTSAEDVTLLLKRSAERARMQEEGHR